MEYQQIMSLSMAIKLSADEFLKRCDELYNYFHNHPNEIIRNSDDRLAFHVGSACYFANMTVNDNSSEQYMLSSLSAFVNLYNALPFADMQACLAAHRLFLLISKNDFMDSGFSLLHYDLQEEKHPLFCECKGANSLKVFAYNFLSQFLLGDESIVTMLSLREQEMFKQEFERIKNHITKESSEIKKGLIVMETLKKNYSSNINFFIQTGHLLTY